MKPLALSEIQAKTILCREQAKRIRWLEKEKATLEEKLKNIIHPPKEPCPKCNTQNTTWTQCGCFSTLKELEYFKKINELREELRECYLVLDKEEEVLG